MVLRTCILIGHDASVINHLWPGLHNNVSEYKTFWCNNYDNDQDLLYAGAVFTTSLPLFLS